MWGVLQMFAGLLAATELSSAMVPAGRMVMEDQVATTTTKTDSTVVICDLETTCGWSVYELGSKQVEYYMKNDYCTCPVNLQCLSYEEVTTVSIAHRCQPQRPTTSTEPETEPPSAGDV